MADADPLHAEDLKTGPKAPHFTLSEAEEAIVVALRRHTLLPLDGRLYALQPSIPLLTRRRYIGACNDTAFLA